MKKLIWTIVLTSPVTSISFAEGGNLLNKQAFCEAMELQNVALANQLKAERELDLQQIALMALVMENDVLQPATEEDKATARAEVAQLISELDADSKKQMSDRAKAQLKTFEKLCRSNKSVGSEALKKLL
jgi:hypothetical protein